MDDETLRDRFELIDDQIAHSDSRIDDVNDRVSALETAKQNKKSHMLEWVVIAIISIETVFSIALYFRHG